MSQMIMTKFGYMSKVEALILGQLAKEEKVKAKEDKKRGRCGDM